MKEYRISTTNRILQLVLAAVFSIGGIASVIAGFRTTHQGSVLPLIIMGTFFILFGVFFYLETTRLCLTIDDQSLTIRHAFNSRNILLDEIADLRHGDKGALLLDLKSGEKPLVIPGTLERRKELQEWLQERYTNSDAERLKEVTESVLENENLGLTREIRENRLNIARKLMVYSSFIAPFLIVLMFFAPKSFDTVTLLLLAIPWLAVGVTWYFKGIFRLYTSKSKPYPSLFILVLFSEMVSLFSVMRNYDVYDYGSKFWLYLLVLSAVVLLAWAIACGAAMAGEKNMPVILLCLFLAAAAHSYSVLIFSNCEEDHSTPLISRVEVSSKHLSRGKSTSYYLELSPWGRFSEGKSVQVSSSFYRSVEQGDSVSVYLNTGKWGIPWYRVSKY
jgi:hypothetical protein